MHELISDATVTFSILPHINFIVGLSIQVLNAYMDISIDL